MTSANVPSVTRRQIFIQLFNGRNSVQSIPSTSTPLTNLRAYAVWKNGETGGAILAPQIIVFYQGDKSRFGILTSVNYSAGKQVNRIDRWTFTYGGDDYIVNISDANILTAFSRTEFSVETPSTLYATFPTGSLISARIQDRLTITLMLPVDNPLYDIWWTDIEGIILTGTLRLPREVSSSSNMFTVSGTLHATNLQKVQYIIGRSSGFAKYRITLEVLAFIPEDPVLPPPIAEITYTMLITDIRLDGDILKGTLSINPALPIGHSTPVQLLYQQRSPNRLPTVIKVIDFTGSGEYDLFDILANQRFTFYWRTTLTNPTRTISSPVYSYMRMAGTIIPDITASQEAELSDSKIYLDRLGATSLSLLIINDLFNTDDVSKVVIGITDSSGTSIQEKANTVFDARIEIDITGLSQETDYSLEVQIVYNEVNKTVATLEVTTLKSLTTESSDAEKQAYTRKNFTRRNYDKEDVDLIENLPISQWDAVVTNSIRQMNDAESDQLPHDLNRFNRRGSVHNTPRSPSPTGNFVGLLSVRIAEESGAIPDIDEGYA